MGGQQSLCDQNTPRVTVNMKKKKLTPLKEALKLYYRRPEGHVNVPKMRIERLGLSHHCIRFFFHEIDASI